jgi:hypothetical protein
MMPADPREGTPSFSQGFAPPPCNWTNRGRIRKLGEKTTVPVGNFDNVLVLEEWSYGMVRAQMRAVAPLLGLFEDGQEP